MQILIAVILAGISPAEGPPKQTGTASTFYPQERWNNGQFACAGRTPQLPAKTMQRWKDESWPICASRTIPCGTWVRVRNLRTNKEGVCLIADRGPYGARMPDGKWAVMTRIRLADGTLGWRVRIRLPGNSWRVETSRKKPGRYLGILDMGPDLSNTIGSDGWDPISQWWTRPEDMGLWERFLTSVMDLWFSYATGQISIR